MHTLHMLLQLDWPSAVFLGTAFICITMVICQILEWRFRDKNQEIVKAMEDHPFKETPGGYGSGLHKSGPIIPLGE